VKLEDYRETFYSFSGKASDLNRQLAFAGIALIWLFKKDSIGGLSIPHELLLPAIFIVLSLAFDMGHYIVASVIWRLYYRSKEKLGIDEDRELKQHSVHLEWPIYFFFCAKIVFVLSAYCLLLQYLLQAISTR
jgi:hypothetical protein